MIYNSPDHIKYIHIKCVENIDAKNCKTLNEEVKKM